MVCEMFPNSEHAQTCHYHEVYFHHLVTCTAYCVLTQHSDLECLYAQVHSLRRTRRGEEPQVVLIPVMNRLLNAAQSLVCVCVCACVCVCVCVCTLMYAFVCIHLLFYDFI